MKHYSKFNLFDADAPTTIPTLGVQIVDTQCFHCGRVTRIPVPHTYTDWEKVAEEYRAMYEKLVARVDRIIKDIDVMQAGSNPVREYLANEWLVIIEDMKRDFSK